MHSRSRAHALPLALAGLVLAACLAAVPCVVLTQPKRPASSYMLWLSENRARITEDIGTKNVAEVAKEAGKLWSSLGQEEKGPYDEQAAELKGQYELDMKAFLDAGGVKQTSKKAPKKAAKGGKAKKQKDPNAPKRPVSAYMLWLKDNRDEVVASLPAEDQRKVTLVSKAAGEQWRQVSADVKEEYEKKLEVAKAEHKKAMAKYEAMMGSKALEGEAE